MSPIKQIVVEESQQPVLLQPNGTEKALAVRAPTPLSILEMAVQQGADVEKLAQLMQLQERWEANEARKAFVAALAKFKASPPILQKNKRVHFASSKGNVDYRHATLDKVAEVIGKELSKHGLSFRWQTSQEQGRIRVTCFLQHEMGHGESVMLEAPADESGAKNAIQAIGSTVTYLERYTLLAATGMATADQDTDGASIPTGKASEHVGKIQNAKTLAELHKVYAEAYKEATAAKDKNAMAIYIEAKDKRKAELK